MKKEHLIALVESHQPTVLPQTAIESAVLLLIVSDDHDNMHLVITKRSSDIAYAGDYCFPGGSKDNFDKNFNLTVKREAEEELGINEKYYQIIGQLDDFHDRYGNRVRPFVALMSKMDFEMNAKMANDEVEEIYFFPLSELRNIKENTELEQLTRRHPSYLYTNGNFRVWGLTASLMVHFSNIIFNLKKQVGNTIKSP